MTVVEDKWVLCWCSQIIREIKKQKGVVVNSNVWDDQRKTEKEHKKRKHKEMIENCISSWKETNCVHCKYMLYVYKQCLLLQNHLRIKHVCNQKQNKKCILLKKFGNNVRSFRGSLRTPQIGEETKWKGTKDAFNYSYKRDRIITQLLVLTLFNTSLLKISLKFFNYLMISIVNQVFEEGMLLAKHNYEDICQTEVVIQREENAKEFQKNNIPPLPVYKNFIQKFKITQSTYFVMICWNCIIFSKEPFFKNTIDYFFREVFSKSVFASTYIKHVINNCCNKKNIKCDNRCNIEYTYCIKVLLIYFFLSKNNILNRSYLNLLVEMPKVEDSFIQSLVHFVYLNYYGIGNGEGEKGSKQVKCATDTIEKELTWEKESCEVSKGNKKRTKGELRPKQLKKRCVNVLEKKSFLKALHNSVHIHAVLIANGFPMEETRYLYIEKFKYNYIKNSIMDFSISIENVAYPIFSLKCGIQKKAKDFPTYQNKHREFILTKRFKKIVEALVINIYNKQATILIGAPGCGKTSLISFIHQQIFQNKKHTLENMEQSKQNVINLYLDDISDSKSILGIWESNEKTFEFKYGVLAKAMKEGNWIVFENINTISNSIVEKLHEFTNKGSIYIPEKGEYIHPHPNFRLFATITVNTENNFADTCKTDKDMSLLYMDEHTHKNSNNEERDIIMMNHRTDQITSLFNKWQSIYIGSYTNQEIQEILTKTLKHIHIKYLTTVLDTFFLIKKDLDEYGILRTVHLHDLIKIKNRIKKRCIFNNPNESNNTLIVLLHICKAVLLSHIPSVTLRNAFLKTLSERFHLNVESIINYSKDISLKKYVDEFNNTLKKKCLPIHFNFEKIQKHSFLLTSVHKSIVYEIIESVYNKESILLVGDTGVGKTALVDYVSKIFGKKLHVFVFSEQSEASDLIGNYYPFNISVKSNELLKELKRFNKQLKVLCIKELNLFYLKLRLALSEKKYVTFLNTCFNYIEFVITALKMNAKLFEMTLIKKAVMFRAKCKGVIEFWTQNSISNDTALPGGKVKPRYALRYDFENLFKEDIRKVIQKRDASIEVNASVYKINENLTEDEEKVNNDMNELIFKFHEGILIDCIKNGHWILLDEINLAQTEILQRIQGLLDSSNKYFDIVEKGNEQIKKHKNFRLFACMNPPIIPVVTIKKKNANKTEQNGNKEREGIKAHKKNVLDISNSSVSAGKKELPLLIRSKFTEIFVDQNYKYEDVEMIVKHLLKGVTQDTQLISNITNCYLKIKEESEKMKCSDNIQIHFSTRNLVRALKYAIHVYKRAFHPLPLNIAIRNGFFCNFLSSLDNTTDHEETHMALLNIFNQYFQSPVSNKKNKNESEENIMRIEKNGVLNFDILEHFYEYVMFDSKSKKEQKVTSIHNGIIKPEKHLKENEKRRSAKKKIQTYACIENSWILCGKEPIHLKKILSNFIITKTVNENIRKLALCVSGIKTPILLEGNTSVGKTSLVQFLANVTGHKFIRINNHMNTDLSEYFGQFVNDPNSGNLIFEEGIFVKAVRKGYWVVLDELNLAPSEVLEALNRILDDNKELYIPEIKSSIKAHKDFMLFATQNPANSSSYVGRKELSKAFRSRFIEFRIGDMPPEELEVILHNRCFVTPMVARKMVNVYTELQSVKSEYSYFNDNIMTLRDLLKWANRKPADQLEAALHGYYVIAEKLRNTNDKEKIENILVKHFLKRREQFVLNYQQDEDVKTTIQLFETKVQQLLQGEQCNSKERFVADDMKRLQYLKDMHFGKSTCRMLSLLLKCFKYGESPLLIGETGCGKTTCCELLGFVKNIKLNILNCNESTDVYDIIGSLKLIKNSNKNMTTVKKCCVDIYNEVQKEYKDPFILKFLSGIIHDKVGEIKKEDYLIFYMYMYKKYNVHAALDAKMKKLERAINTHKSIFSWNDGILVKSLKSGDIFLMDEISLVESSVIERLNSVLESERTLLLTEKGGGNVTHLKAHKNFTFIGTMNPSGDFGKKEISHALRNRFTEIFVPAFEFESEDFSHLIYKQIRFTENAKWKKAIAQHISLLFRDILQNHTFLRVSLSVRDATNLVAFMNAYVEERNTKQAKEEQIKKWIVYSFYHSGCLILIDGNEEVQIKNILKTMLLRTLEMLATEIHYNIAMGKEQWDHTSHHFCLSQDRLLVNDFCIYFREHLQCDSDAFTKQFHFVLDTKNIQNNIFKIVRAMQLNNSILIEGSPGVGKTCIVTMLAKMTKNKLVRINLSECTDIYDFIGSYFPLGLEEEKTKPTFDIGTEQKEDDKKAAFQYIWRDGKLVECMKKGYWILIDEINLANQQTLEGLNSILDHRKEIYVPETNEVVKSHKNFRIFCCQNPYKEGGGRKGLPKSFINRFSKIYFDDLDEEDYFCIVEKLYADFISLFIIKKIIKIITVIHKINNLLSDSDYWSWNLRDVLRICKFIKNKMPNDNLISICDILLCSRLTTAEDKDIVRKIIEYVFYENPLFLKKWKTISTRQDLIECTLRIPTTQEHLQQVVVSSPEQNTTQLGDCLYNNKFTYDEQFLYYQNIVLKKGKQNVGVQGNMAFLSKDENIFLRCLAAIKFQIPVLLCGKNNTGKSSFVHKIATLFKKQIFEFPLTNDVDTLDLFGSYEQNSISNAILRLEKEMHTLNQLLLRNLFRKNLSIAKFYETYFMKRLNKKTTQFSDTMDAMDTNRNTKKIIKMKTEVMMELNLLTNNYLNNLKETNKEQWKITQEKYMQFVRLFSSFMKKKEKKVTNYISSITYIANRIIENKINENVYIYTEGDFIKAVKNGHWILMKHLHYSTSSLLDRLNSLFEESGYLLLHEFGKKKKIKPHKNFQIFLTLDADEHYKISRALRNRCFEIFFGEQNEVSETEFLNVQNCFQEPSLSLNVDYCPSIISEPLSISEKENSETNVANEEEQMKNRDSHLLFHSLLHLCQYSCPPWNTQLGYNTTNDENSHKDMGSNKEQMIHTYYRLVWNNNIFLHIWHNFVRNLEKTNSTHIIKELQNFIIPEGIQINIKKLFDYVHFCYNSFCNNGAGGSNEIFYFCLIISIFNVFIDFICDKETWKRKSESLKMKNKIWNGLKKAEQQLLNDYLTILWNYKFDNIYYYTDVYITSLCSNFLIVNNYGREDLPKWKSIFATSFQNFYCGLFSKLNRKIQMFFFPFFKYINNVLIKTIYILKKKSESFLCNKKKLNCLVTQINKEHSSLYRRNKTEFVYLYLHVFIQYICRYRKTQERYSFFTTSQKEKNGIMLMEATLIESLLKYRLNKLFCYLIYCFVENFSIKDISDRCLYLKNMKEEIKAKRIYCKEEKVFDRNIEKYLSFVTDFLSNRIEYFDIFNTYVYTKVLTKKAQYKNYSMKEMRKNLLAKPLIAAKKYLLHIYDSGMSRILHFFEICLKNNMSYDYFMKNKKEKKKGNKIFEYMNQFLMFTEQYIFHELKNGDQQIVTTDLFHLHIFVYAFAFEILCQSDEKTLYNKIILLKDVLKILCAMDKRYATDIETNLKFMNFLHNWKIQMEKIADVTNTNSFEETRFLSDGKRENSRKSQWKEAKILQWDDSKYDANVIKNTFQNHRRKKSWSEHFENKWIKNIFEIVNNIYVSYSIFIQNKETYALVLLNSANYDTNGRNKNFISLQEELWNRTNRKVEQLLIQTKSFSHALNFLSYQSEYDRIAVLENRILKNVQEYTDKLGRSSYVIDLKQEDVAFENHLNGKTASVDSEEEPNEMELQDAGYTSEENYQNVSFRLDVHDKRAYTDYMHTEHKMSTKNNILFYYEFLMCNINLRYIFNSFIYLLNMYMQVKFYTFHNNNDDVVFAKDRRDIKKIQTSQQVALKNALQCMYAYLEKIDSSLFICEEKIELLSLLKEKFGMLELYGNKIQHNEEYNKHIHIIFSALEEVLYIFFSFLLNIYMIRDKGYAYEKGDHLQLCQAASNKNQPMNAKLYRNVFAVKRARNSLDSNLQKNKETERIAEEGKKKNIRRSIEKHLHRITFEEYSIFKNIYFNESFKNMENEKLYSYYNSSIFNKTIIFDSLLKMEKEIKKNKIYLSHLNITNFVFQNLKRNYYDFVMNQATTDFTFSPMEKCNQKKNKKEEKTQELNMLNKNSLCYFFLFYTCTLLHKIISEHQEGTIRIGTKNSSSFFFELYNTLRDQRKSSVEMWIYLLQLYNYFSYLKIDGKLNKTVQKYVFVLLCLLFQLVFIHWTDSEQDEHFVKADASVSGDGVQYLQTSANQKNSYKYNSTVKDTISSKNSSLSDWKKCNTFHTYANKNVELAVEYLKNNENIQGDKLRDIIQMLFADKNTLLQLVHKYDEELVYYIGALYVSHFLLNVVCVEIKREVKEIFKILEIKRYYKKKEEAMKEEIYMNNQQDLYIGKKNLFEHISYKNYFKIKKEAILKKCITHMKQDLPLLPPIESTLTKREREKINCIKKQEKNKGTVEATHEIENRNGEQNGKQNGEGYEEQNEEQNREHNKEKERTFENVIHHHTNTCASIIIDYLDSKDWENIHDMYKNLKNCFKGFLRQNLSLSNIESILQELNENGGLINFSVVYTCLNFMYHIKEKYGILLKIQHSIFYALNVFIHSIHNINAFSLNQKGENKTTKMNFERIEKNQTEKDTSFYHCIDFPVQFHKLLNLQKKKYGNIEHIEYLDFLIQLMEKPKTIVSDFNFGNLLACLKKLCTHIVVSNERDEFSNMNELYRIEQFKYSAIKEKYETLEESYIENAIEQEVNDVFYSKEYFANQSTEEGENEQKQERHTDPQQQPPIDKEQEITNEKICAEDVGDDEIMKKVNEERFNKIIYRMVKLFKNKGEDNTSKRVIYVTKEHIQRVLDLAVKLNDAPDTKQLQQTGYLLNKINEDKKLLIFTLNLVDQLNKVTSYESEQFATFKRNMLEILLSNRCNHVYVNKCISVTDWKYEDLFSSALNHLCHYLKTLKKFFIPIYNENNNLMLFNILHAIDSVLNIPLNEVKNQTEKIILRLEHIVDLINSLKRFNFINFDESSVKKLTNFTEEPMCKELLIYTLYFRLLKLEKIKNIRKELTRKILKTKTLNLFAYLFYLCDDEQQLNHEEEQFNKSKEEKQVEIGETKNEQVTNDNDVETDQRKKSLFQLKIIKTFETLIVFLRNSMIGEFAFRLNLIFFVGCLFRNSENENEKIMSSVFLNVYSYMYVYYPLIQKKIRMSKKYFDNKLNKFVKNIHLDLVDVEAYKSSIKKLKAQIVYFTHLYFQQIRVTVDRFIMENTSMSLEMGSGGNQKKTFAQQHMDYRTEEEEKEENENEQETQSTGNGEAEIESDISIEEYDWNENGNNELKETSKDRFKEIQKRIEPNDMYKENYVNVKNREREETEEVEEMEDMEETKETKEMEEMEETKPEERTENIIYIINELKEIKVALFKFEKKIKKLKINEFLMNVINEENSFEEISNNYVKEIKNILNYKCVDANVNQKKRWLYILKHFFSKKLQMPYIRELNNFTFFANLFTSHESFTDVGENSLFEFDSTDELLVEMKASRTYNIEQNPILTEETKTQRYNELNEEILKFESCIKESLKKKKLYNLRFLNTINSILTNNEEKNAKILYLIIYIKSIKIHQDIEQDEKLANLFNSIIYEYFHLKQELNNFYRHFVFYYLICESLLMDRKRREKCTLVPIKLLEIFFAKCSLAKTTILQVLSVFYEQLTEQPYFKKVFFTIYKIMYTILGSNEFVIFRYFKNTTGVALLKEMSWECSQLNIKVGEQFMKCLEESILFLNKTKNQIFFLPIPTYFKIKLYEVVKRLVRLFYSMQNAKHEEKEPITQADRTNIEKWNDLNKVNAKIFTFINKATQKKSIIYKNDYPNFKETKAVTEYYAMKEIIELYLQLHTSDSAIFTNAYSRKPMEQKKRENVFFYLSKHLFYCIKGIFLSFLDTYNGFANISLYFLKVLKLLYTKGFCREIENMKDENGEMQGEQEENNDFYKTDFLKGIGLGEGKGINNISDQVDNEDLDNIYREEEQEFSDDEQQFNEEAIEASYDFKKFQEKELNNFDEKNENPNKLENEQDNWNMDKEKTNTTAPKKEEEKKEQQKNTENENRDDDSQLDENIDDIFEKNRGTNENANEKFLEKPEQEEEQKRNGEKGNENLSEKETNTGDEVGDETGRQENERKEKSAETEREKENEAEKEQKKEMEKNEVTDPLGDKESFIDGQEFSDDEIDNKDKKDLSDLPNYETRRQEEQSTGYFDDNMNRLDETSQLGELENDNLDNIFDSDFNIESSDFSDTFSEKSIGSESGEDETKDGENEQEENEQDQLQQLQEKNKWEQFKNEDNFKDALDEMNGEQEQEQKEQTDLQEEGEENEQNTTGIQENEDLRDDTNETNSEEQEQEEQEDQQDLKEKKLGKTDKGLIHNEDLEEEIKKEEEEVGKQEEGEEEVGKIEEGEEEDGKIEDGKDEVGKQEEGEEEDGKKEEMIGTDQNLETEKENDDEIGEKEPTAQEGDKDDKDEPKENEERDIKKEDEANEETRETKENIEETEQNQPEEEEGDNKIDDSSMEKNKTETSELTESEYHDAKEFEDENEVSQINEFNEKKQCELEEQSESEDSNHEKKKYVGNQLNPQVSEKEANVEQSAPMDAKSTNNKKGDKQKKQVGIKKEKENGKTNDTEEEQTSEDEEEGEDGQQWGEQAKQDVDMSEKKEHSGKDKYSLKIDKCNLYTENIVDITNYLDQLNENLFQSDQENRSEKEEMEEADEKRQVEKKDQKNEEEENDEKENDEKENDEVKDSGTKDEASKKNTPNEKPMEKEIQINRNTVEDVNMNNTQKDLKETKNEDNEDNKKEIEEQKEKQQEQSSTPQNKNRKWKDKKKEEKKESSAKKIQVTNKNEEDTLEDIVENQEETSEEEQDSDRDSRNQNEKTDSRFTDEEALSESDSSTSMVEELENVNKEDDLGERVEKTNIEEEEEKEDEDENEKMNNIREQAYLKVHENLKVLEEEYLITNEPNVIEQNIRNEKCFSESLNLENEKLYEEINNETEMMSSKLCEQLKMILEPTVRNKYEGDYKSGKKLNIKKLVNYFASDFRNNKIWKRKTKLSKRDYNILIAIDNTKSMKINNIQKMTLNAIFLVAKAFEKLNVGKIGICSFGETKKVCSKNIVCSMTNTLTKQDFLKILKHFQFNHDTKYSFDTAMLNALQICSQIFKTTGTSGNANNSKNNLNQLMLIISDGRFNKASVKEEIYKCIQNNYVPVLMIIDAHLSNNAAQSIFNLKQTFYKNNKIQIVPYLQDFPFPYFVVVNDINNIPTMTCEIIRQWFQLINTK